jgi:hypothetical protein
MAAEAQPVGLTGGCQCGAVRYRLDAAPTGANVCHCRMCQKAGGAPFMAFAGVRLAELVWTRGAPKIFVSSAIGERGFCGDCGTPLTYRGYGRDRVSVTIGSLDAPATIAPVMQFSPETRIPWLDDIAALPFRDFSVSADPIQLGNRQHPDHDA